MDKTYTPSEIETRWYQQWEDAGYFKGDETSDKPPYSIMIPPPNVTGVLHMGHGLTMTIQDILTRYHRMKGYNTLWQPGTDHAGIATQMVVERQLNAEGKTRHDLGRDAFIEKIWDWKDYSGGTIQGQLRRLGTSLDWERERFTMDDGLSKAVSKVFIDLYDKGIIYRGQRLVNWDPVLLTALSDLEVINEEENGHLWHLRYPLRDGGHLVVATTRPETMLGDSAVAVHPEDSRYQHLIGQTIQLPFTDREIPIIADDYVDPEFGTGCVKITPAHDFNDYAMGQRHNLPMINILTPTASLNDNVPEKYRDKDRYDVRKMIIADFEAAGLLEKIDKHTLKVPRGDRSGAVVEPYLTDQWYVDLTRMEQPDGRPGGKSLIAIPSIDAIRNGDIQFVPKQWENTYFQWLENLQDWCISRQIWWGHRIPAWYDDAGNVYVADSEEAARAKYQLAADLRLSQETDVLDTWFSSALWPFSTLGWPENTDALKTWYPTSVLVTGFDIIFFWVARMIMAGLTFMDDIPFKDIYIHGLVRDHNGQKMSKSKGNVLDPLDIIDGIELETLVEKRTANMMQPHLKEKIEKQTREQFPEGIASYGADALRFTFAALATNGRDCNFDLKRVEGYRNFCNKLWNATRYVLMHCEDQDTGLGNDPVALSAADRWILTRFNQVAEEANKHIADYRFDLMAKAIYDFTWNEYCDWYLELSKPILFKAESEAIKRGARQTLVRVLEGILSLAHPIMPFITEEIWQKVQPLTGTPGETLMLLNYPEHQAEQIDLASIEEIEWVQQFVLGVRQIRAEMDIKPSKELPLILADATAHDKQRVEEHRLLLNSLVKVESLSFIDDANQAPESATALVGQMKVLVPLGDLIDKEAELARLNKAIEKAEKECSSLKGKLSNENFVSRAPEAVVNKERERLSAFEQDLANLKAQRDKIAAM